MRRFFEKEKNKFEYEKICKRDGLLSAVLVPILVAFVTYLYKFYTTEFYSIQKSVDIDIFFITFVCVLLLSGLVLVYISYFILQLKYFYSNNKPIDKLVDDANNRYHVFGSIWSVIFILLFLYSIVLYKFSVDEVMEVINCVSAHKIFLIALLIFLIALPIFLFVNIKKIQTCNQLKNLTKQLNINTIVYKIKKLFDWQLIKIIEQVYKSLTCVIRYSVFSLMAAFILFVLFFAYKEERIEVNYNNDGLVELNINSINNINKIIRVDLYKYPANEENFIVKSLIASSSDCNMMSSVGVSLKFSTPSDIVNKSINERLSINDIKMITLLNFNNTYIFDINDYMQRHETNTDEKYVLCFDVMIDDTNHIIINNFNINGNKYYFANNKLTKKYLRRVKIW